MILIFSLPLAYKRPQGKQIWGRRDALKSISVYIKKQRHYFANKGLSSQGYGFSSGHVWMHPSLFLIIECEFYSLIQSMD